MADILSKPTFDMISEYDYSSDSALLAEATLEMENGEKEFEDGIDDEEFFIQNTVSLIDEILRDLGL